MAEITYIPVGQLREHPLNPRKDLGDLTELAESIKGNGILQNLTVVPIACVPKLTGREYGVTDPRDDDLYVVVIGHRRLAAAKMAEEDTVPCSIVTMSQGQQQETMLIENMQRSDLTVYEQAQGFQMMLDMGHSVQTIVNRTGFSETTVRRRLKMAELDQKKLKEVSVRQISLMDFDRLAQIEDLDLRNECLDKIGTNDFDLAVKKAVKHQNVNQNMPQVKAWQKSVKAKKLQRSESWSGKYERVGSTIYIDKWGEDVNKPAAGIENKKVFYYLGENGYDFGELTLYYEKEKAPPVKRAPEEIARERAIAEAHQKLDAAASLAYDLRKQFVEKLTVTRKNESQVILGAVFAGSFNAVNYNSADRVMLHKVIGIDPSEAYISDREKKLWDAFDRISGNDWAKLVYSLFGDDANQTCASGYKREVPKYTRSIKLELIYRWLCSLGYEISTEEAQIMTGDHEAFKAGEQYAEM